MSTFEPTPPDPSLLTRRSSDDLSPDDALYVLRRRIFLRTALTLTALTLILAVAGFFLGRHWVRQAMRDSLPQLDGALSLPGLTAPVTIQRDAHGVPHLRAASLDDLVIAQGFVTTQDRLWQMDVLRRHAAGELAEILGPTLISHDRIQRTLRLRASADRAFATLPPDQLHWLELYARGVNASIASQLPHLPLEFRLLRYEPTPWT
ncbi:MAG TPA: penicillin acylase family protein, partial [Edaphobacter sp.]|nr:penicillin acylase family protein [Edaphobacter sp.]